MKVGLSLGISPREPIEHTVEVVQHAELVGFDSVWIADVQMSMKDCYVALALCAKATSSIRLATGVTNPVTRHPTTIANAFSALQEISDGRAIVGLGSGWTAVYSIGLEPARIAEVEKAVRTIQKLTGGEKIEDHEGGAVELKTAQQRVPVFVAANQPKILAMTGRVADGAILMGGANPEFTSWQLEHLAKGADEAGRSLDDLEVHLWSTISVSDDEQKAIDDVSHWIASQAETFSKWRKLPEFLETYAEEFKAASEAYDRLDHMSQHAKHKNVVSRELVKYLAIVGTVEECLQQIQELSDLGVDGVTLAFRAGGRTETMTRLSEEIIKPLKAQSTQPEP